MEPLAFGISYYGLDEKLSYCSMALLLSSRQEGFPAFRAADSMARAYPAEESGWRKAPRPVKASPFRRGA